ncbi:MAG: hypothetical protein QOG54_41 [Actinomycetota bacterium]|jgi:hypothetical protein|nr:hypothetical protein [Actinomycetota bacterium]
MANSFSLRLGREHAVVVSEVEWPMGVERDLGSLPLEFSPKGFLVAILHSEAQAESSMIALRSVGFATEDMRVYTSSQILVDQGRYLETRSLGRRLAGSISDGQADIELYFAYAHEGRAALWIHVPEKHDASRAARYLSDHQVLHFRHVRAD